MNEKDLSAEILSMLNARAKYYFSKEYYNKLVDAVVDLEVMPYLCEIPKIINALRSFIAKEDGTELLKMYKRINNILEKGISDGKVIEAKFVSDIENVLYAKILEAELETSVLMKVSNYDGYLERLADLKEPLSNMFDNLMIKDNDPEITKNRMAMSYRIKTMFDRIANFSILII